MKRSLLIVGLVLMVLSAVLLTGGLVQFIIPPTFQSVARILIQPESSGIPGNEHWVQTEVEKLQSRMVLYQVITNLDLNRKWGEKFKEGELTDLTYKILRNQLRIQPGRGTALIEVHVRSDDPIEAAAIANNIAEVYRNQRTARTKDIHRNEESGLEIRDSIVQIIDAAEPNLRPVKPHPLMKILVPVAGLLAGVLGIVLLMLAVMKGSTRKSPPPLPA